MFVTLVVTNVLWLDLFRDHSVESWRYLDHDRIRLGDFAEEQRHRDSLGQLEERYEFHWPHYEGTGFSVMINESELKNDRYLVAISSLFILAVWTIGTAILAKRQRRPEPGAAPNGGPATPLASSEVTEGPPSVI